jgi:hypothetical protein
VDDISTLVLLITSKVSLIIFTFKGSHALADGCYSSNDCKGSSTGNTSLSSIFSAIVVRKSSSPLASAGYSTHGRLKLASIGEKT